MNPNKRKQDLVHLETQTKKTQTTLTHTHTLPYNNIKKKKKKHFNLKNKKTNIHQTQQTIQQNTTTKENMSAAFPLTIRHRRAHSEMNFRLPDDLDPYPSNSFEELDNNEDLFST